MSELSSSCRPCGEPSSRRHGSVIVTLRLVLSVVVVGLGLPVAAEAARTATALEIAEIAEAVDMNPECLVVTVSTVVSGYAKTAIDRSSCDPAANGYLLLRSSAAGWQVHDSGPDDYGPCSGEEKGPAAVLRDLRICEPKLPRKPKPKSRRCGRFVIGKANSTAYARLRLPARGSVTSASCTTLRGIARRLHDGTYRLPSSAFARAPQWGIPAPVRHAGVTWNCRVQNVGMSGPSYRVRCARNRALMTWATG